jgi:hypothetical protein
MKFFLFIYLKFSLLKKLSCITNYEFKSSQQVTSKTYLGYQNPLVLPLLVVSYSG